jgi:hypothetical protein
MQEDRRVDGFWAAAFWGGLSGSALVLGAAIAWWAEVPARVVAATMAFGSGVLISALSFDLMQEAFHQGGFTATAAGFLGGGAIFTAANMAIAGFGGAGRKRSGDQQPKAEEAADSASRSARCWMESRRRSSSASACWAGRASPSSRSRPSSSPMCRKGCRARRA